MLFAFEERQSDAPFVEGIWRTHSERIGIFTSLASVHWELVVSKYGGVTTLTVRGPEMKATPAVCSVLGGKRLFAPMAHPVNLTRARTESFKNGVVVLYYEQARS